MSVWSITAQRTSTSTLTPVLVQTYAHATLIWSEVKSTVHDHKCEAYMQIYLFEVTQDQTVLLSPRPGAETKLSVCIVPDEPAGCAQKIWSEDGTMNKPESYIGGSSASPD